MKPLPVLFAPEAEAQLLNLEAYIASKASPAIAQRFVDAIVDRCVGLSDLPKIGRARDDIRPGLRTLSYKRRAIVAYAVSKAQVTILGVYYGGQDFETLLAEDDD